jgi:hypothetical protein
MPCWAQKYKKLSKAEKNQIVYEILSDTDFLKGDPPRKEEKIVNLSTENLPLNFTPTKIKRVKIQLLTPQEVEEKSYSGFDYYVFKSFEMKGSKLIITFNYYDKNGSLGAFFMGTTDYVYRKISGKWKRFKKIRYANAMS